MANLNVRPKIWYDYMKWLTEKIGFDKKNYYNLIKCLHDTEFTWLYDIEKDENRAGDGIYQRYYFIREKGGSDDIFPEGCSVLEMLVGFASRMGSDYVGYSVDGLDAGSVIFWMFLVNLGLDKFDDKRFDEGNVKYILHFWMDRRYKNDGNGSIFRLKRSVSDYNKMEIWKQMNVFLTQFEVENADDILKIL